MKLLLSLTVAAATLVACSGGNDEPPTTFEAAPSVTAPTAVRPATSATPVPAGSATAVASARVVRRGDPERRTIALTFDAGSDAGFTTETLATLRDAGVRATFGVTGLWAEAYPDLLNAIAADGHQIMNHSYSHASFTGASTGSEPLTRDERRLELSRTETTVFRLSSRSTQPFFRPPYGDFDTSVLADIAEAGYGFLVLWTVDSRGWQGAAASEITATVIDAAEPGAIVVLQVGAESQDAAALPGIIAALREDGYGFATVSEIIE